MPIEIVVPRLGWSMDEGTFAGWLLLAGQPVSSGDMLFQLEGDKATQEVESFDAGTLCIPADAPQEGDTVLVGQVIGFLLADGEPPPSTTKGSAAEANKSATLDPETLDPETLDPETLDPETLDPKTLDPKTLNPKTLASGCNSVGPAARRLARELGVDLANIQGSGNRGRITSDDVRTALANPATGNSIEGIAGTRLIATPRARQAARIRGVNLAGITGTGRGGRIRERDVTASASKESTDGARPTKLRQAIARRMMEGTHLAAPVTLFKKVRADALIQFRQELKDHPLANVSPTLNELLLQLTCKSLQQHPRMNATLNEGRFVESSSVHLAFAVDTSAGLLAPVVKSAEKLTLAELCLQTRTCIDGARRGSLRENDLSGGTFTVSNLGGLGIDGFTPIINLPQVAILGIGRAVEEPVVENRQLVVGWTMQLSLTFDHRAVDGADGARLLDTLASMIDHPARWLFQ